MTELVSWAEQERKTARLYPLLFIALSFVVFLEIHPFQDGKGRLSRILITHLLLQARYAYVPYSSLKSGEQGQAREDRAGADKEYPART